jgi:hypothetical protein
MAAACTHAHTLSYFLVLRHCLRLIRLCPHCAWHGQVLHTTTAIDTVPVLGGRSGKTADLPVGGLGGAAPLMLWKIASFRHTGYFAVSQGRTPGRTELAPEHGTCVLLLEPLLQFATWYPRVPVSMYQLGVCVTAVAEWPERARFNPAVEAVDLCNGHLCWGRKMP